MSYATWKPLPQLSREDEKAQRSLPTQARVVMALMILGGLLLTVMGSGDGRIAGIMITIVGVCMGLMPLDKSRPSIHLKRLTEKYSGRPYHAVRITIYKDNKKIGQDQGIVTFDKAMLIYEGVRTDFALGRGDVFLPEGALETANPWFGNPPAGIAWGFKLADDPSIRLSFESLAVAYSDYISWPLAQWLQSDEMAGGKRMLPPNVPLS